MFPSLVTRKNLLHVVNFLQVVVSSYIAYQGIGLLTNTQSPVVVVLSESMEPAFARGDILFLTNLQTQPYKTGDIVVYNIPGEQIPIVHRIIEAHTYSVTPDQSMNNGEQHVFSKPKLPSTSRKDAWTQQMLTKGDNNPVDDRDMIYKGKEWLGRPQIIGQVQGFLPYLGYVTILMNDYPQLKYALLGSMAVFSLLWSE